MRRLPTPSLCLFLAAAAATQGCAMAYARRSLTFGGERTSEVLAVTRAAVDHGQLFVDLVTTSDGSGGTRRVTVRLPLSELAGELRLPGPVKDGLLESWSRVGDRARVARLSGRAVRGVDHFPKRAPLIPVREVQLDEFSAPALPATSGVDPVVYSVAVSLPPSTLVGVVLPHPAPAGAEWLFISGADERHPVARSYAVWAGAFVVDVFLAEVAIGMTLILLCGGF
jgi:hypothetical protein